MITQLQLEASTGFETYDYVTDNEIPTFTGLQCQGDMAIVPFGIDPDDFGKGNAPDAKGSVILAGVHNHTLFADGPGVKFVDNQPGLVLAKLLVEEGSTALFLHKEHTALSVGAGTYQIRQQRELAKEEQLVKD